MIYIHVVDFYEQIVEDTPLYQYINRFSVLDLSSTRNLSFGLTTNQPVLGTKNRKRTFRGYGIINTGCLNHAITSTFKFNMSLSYNDEFISIRSAFDLYLEGLSRSTLSNNNWVMTWTDGCHSIECAIQCVTSNSAGYNHHHIPVYVLLVLWVSLLLSF